MNPTVTPAREITTIAQLLAQPDLPGFAGRQHLARVGFDAATQPGGTRVSTLVAAGVDRKSSRKYAASLRQYATFVRVDNLPSACSKFPIPISGLWPYLAALSGAVEYNTVLQHLSGLKYWHDALGTPWPARDDPGTRSILAAIRRAPRHRPVEQANPISLDHLKRMHNRIDGTRQGHALLWMLSTFAFHGLLRPGEFALGDTEPETLARAVRLSDITQDTTASGIPFVMVSLRYAKHNNPTTATDIRLLATGDVTCPVAAWENYRRVVNPPGPYAFTTTAGEIVSRRWFITSVTNFLEGILQNPSGYSFRSGGAIHLVHLGFTADMIKARGRWTDDTWHRYVRHNNRFWTELEVRYRFLVPDERRPPPPTGV